MPTRSRRAKLLQPLRHRDFALLAERQHCVAAGRRLLLRGAGVAGLRDQQRAHGAERGLGGVDAAESVIFLLIGGAFSDRYDRRLLMVWADVIRALAIGAIGLLSIAGALEIWHIAVLIVFVGIGDAFFNPASTAIIPDIVPEEDLLQANALRATLMPLMVRMVGPPWRASWSPQSALAGRSLSTRPHSSSPPSQCSPSLHGCSITRMSTEFGRHSDRCARAWPSSGRYPWLWATLVGALLSLLVFFGPVETLLPFLVKNRLNLGPESLGLIFAAGGVGAILPDSPSASLGCRASA